MKDSSKIDLNIEYKNSADISKGGDWFISRLTCHWYLFQERRQCLCTNGTKLKTGLYFVSVYAPGRISFSFSFSVQLALLNCDKNISFLN